MQNQFSQEQTESHIPNPYQEAKPTPAPAPPKQAFPSKSSYESGSSFKKLALRLVSIILLGLGLGLLFYSVYTFATSKKTEFQQTANNKPKVIMPTPTLTPTPPIAGWQTYTSSQGFSMQYESPVVFNAEFNGLKETLTYQLVSVEGKLDAFEILVSSEATDKNSVTELEFSGAVPATVGKYSAIVLASPDKEIYYIVEKGKTFEIEVKLLLDAETPASNSLKEKILKSFVVR